MARLKRPYFTTISLPDIRNLAAKLSPAHWWRNYRLLRPASSLETQVMPYLQVLCTIGEKSSNTHKLVEKDLPPASCPPPALVHIYHLTGGLEATISNPHPSVEANISPMWNGKSPFPFLTRERPSHQSQDLGQLSETLAPSDHMPGYWLTTFDPDTLHNTGEHARGIIDAERRRPIPSMSSLANGPSCTAGQLATMRIVRANKL